MTTILLIFVLSVIVSFLLTPLVGVLARRFGVMDKPSERKLHTCPLPTAGGIAIYVAFFIPFAFAVFFSNKLTNQIYVEASLLWLAVGATLVFALGIFDDVRRLKPKIKMAAQAVAALVAYAGGVRIVCLELPFVNEVTLGWMAFPITLFWFIFVINAINLIDGLDGLAAGVSLFASIVLLALSVMGERYIVASGLAALAGSCLGFLCFNFNPASIFMGNGGSYFLGFMLAGLSIMGSMKSQATVAILFPVIALGVPLIDAFIAPIRRVVLGKDPFEADTSHIHHKLLKMGLNQRRAVLWIYGTTIFLGLVALAFVRIRDERAGFLLLVLGVGLLFAVRKLGYLKHMAMDKMLGYFNDVTDEMGLKKERRSFLNLQLAIMEACTPEEMWDSIVRAVKMLKIDQAEIRLNGVCLGPGFRDRYLWSFNDLEQSWEECQENILSIELPLVTGRKSYGILSLKKDLQRDSLSHYTLKRIEHLRRSIVQKLAVFESQNAGRARHFLLKAERSVEHRK